MLVSLTCQANCSVLHAHLRVTARASKNLSAARSAFGEERVVLLRINSGNTATGAVDGTGIPPGAFSCCMRTALQGGGAGARALVRTGVCGCMRSRL